LRIDVSLAVTLQQPDEPFWMVASSSQIQHLLPGDYAALRSFSQRLFRELLLPCRRYVGYRAERLGHGESLTLLNLGAVQTSAVQH
jgi:hypothetical protein